MHSKVNLFSGRAHPDLSQKIAEKYNKALGHALFLDFSDREFEISYEESVRGDEVFIIQPTFMPLDNLFELLMMVDAAKRASAKQIIAVIPYFGFARQDRKSKPRVAISAKLVANLLRAAGVDRVITMDLHSDQIQGFFDVPVDHLCASSVFVPYLKNLNLSNLTMASPDTGGGKRAAAYAKFLNTDLVICFKQREKENQVSQTTPIGNVKGKDIVLVDDMIDTAGTITKAADVMMEKGANSVRALCTHPVLSGNAYEKIERCALQEVIVSDTIPLHNPIEKITVLSVAELFADVIECVTSHKSISSHFKFNTIV